MILPTGAARSRRRGRAGARPPQDKLSRLSAAALAIASWVDAAALFSNVRECI